MEVRTGSATRAKISTSTLAAPARFSARAQPSTVAPEVKTSSTRTNLRLETAALLSSGTLNAPCTLLARSVRVSPTCCAVALTRLSIPAAMGTRLSAEIVAASMADWLKRRAHCRRQCSGTGTSASASARSSRPACATQRPIIGASSAPGLRYHASHYRAEFEPVAVFQRMDQGARYLVEPHRGASAVIGRRVGDGLHGQDARTRVIHERNAEPL